MHFLDPSLFFLLDILSRYEWNRGAIWGLDVDLGGQGALVHNLQVLSVLFTENYIAKVDFGLLDLDKGFFAGADERNVDFAGFTQNWEDGVDVFVELGGERDRDRGGKTG